VKYWSKRKKWQKRREGSEERQTMMVLRERCWLDAAAVSDDGRLVGLSCGGRVERWRCIERSTYFIFEFFGWQKWGLFRVISAARPDWLKRIFG
jgi:hypothetical protein